MICRFCTQWNPPSARRCCFCDNAVDASEDGSRHGTPAYLRNTGQQFHVPPAERSRFDLSPEVAELDLVGLWRRGGVQRWLLGVGGIVVVIVVLGMLIRGC